MYRDQAPPNKHKTLVAVKEAFNSYIKKKCSKAHIPEIMCAEWKDAILTTVKNELDSFPVYDYNAVLSKPPVTEALSRLQQNFVFVPTDKASNNVSIVCKMVLRSFMFSYSKMKSTAPLISLQQSP